MIDNQGEQRFLIDDQFTYQILIDAGLTLTPVGAIWRLLTPKIAPLMMSPDVYYVDGHYLYAFGANLLALDSPHLLVELLPYHAPEAMMREAIDAIDLITKDTSSLDQPVFNSLFKNRQMMKAHLQEAGNSWQVQETLAQPLVRTETRAALWEWCDPPIVFQTEESTEGSLLDQMRTALDLPTAEARAVNLLSLYNECYAVEDWQNVACLRENIAVEGFEVVDGLGAGDLARIIKKI